MNTLNEIADAVHLNAISKGFHPEEQSLHTFMANQCNNIHAEVTELWDSWRAGTQNKLCDKAEAMLGLSITDENGDGLTQQEEELADIIIRALDVSRRLKIDIQRAIELKHAYNITRPFKHGKLN